ncbi:MAG: protoporphyrinogen oxidase [Anaerolineae bacterium]
MSSPATLDFHAVIVGGGIVGMSAAWFLQLEAAAKDTTLIYALLEQAGRWGGKIHTEIVEGEGAEPFVVEAGPDSFLTQKPWALQLARSLGLEDRLLPTNDQMRHVFVLNKGRPTPLPDGVMLIVPTKFAPFVRSPLISPLGKLRMGLDLLIPPRKDGRDETLAGFIKRRLGAEALDKIAEPLMSGIYNADAERQSLMATFPRFRAIEEKHGSLIRGMLAARRARQAAPPSNARKPPAMFTSFRTGMHELVDALLPRLTGKCLLETAVQSIRPLAGGGFELVLNDGRRVTAATVLLAVPAYAAARLVAEAAPAAASGLAGIRYVGTGTVTLAFRRNEFTHPLNGFGILIPRSEKRPINAITWSSTKFTHRAPEGFGLIRVFFGGSRTPSTMGLADGELLETVRGELKELMGITAEPVFHRIYRWSRSTPQYDVGHLARVTEIEAALPDGLFVAGSPYRGVGVPDCVHQAQQAAALMVQHLASTGLAGKSASLPHSPNAREA